MNNSSKLITVHTIAHNENDVLKINKIIKKNEKNIEKHGKKESYNINFKIWEEKDILKLIKKYNNQKYKIFYNNLITNKSKDDFIKYLILFDEGGLFINNVLLQNNNNYVFLSEFIRNTNKNIVFFEEEKTLGLEKSLLKKDTNLINDDVIYIGNKNNDLMLYIINNIDYDKQIKNQYQTKLNLGSYFLTNQVNNFYFKDSGLEMDETVLNFVTLQKHPINTIKYKEELYPNAFELVNPTNEFDKYSKYNDIANYISLFGLLLFYLLGRWDLLVLYLIVAAVGIYIARYYIYSLIDNEPQRAEIDNKYFYNTRDFGVLKELRENYKIIKEEAKNVLKNAPKLDIYRNYDDWHNSHEYVNKIKNEYGWIRSWMYKDGQAVKSDGNYNWLNYGMLYFGEFFDKNCEQCPKTKELLSKIKDKINICGFSYVMGNTTIEIHSDETGPSNNSMAVHLGLIIPKNPETCKLIMKVDDNYYYETEKEGKLLIFDATNYHYAYNQSNEDRVVLYIDMKY